MTRFEHLGMELRNQDLLLSQRLKRSLPDSLGNIDGYLHFQFHVVSLLVFALLASR
jgi:hypothetical protein